MMDKELKTGSPCPSGCGGEIYLNTLSCKFLCSLCSYSAPLELPVHERPIAYIAGALNDMSCAYLQNVRQMILWAEKIRELGYAVFIPGIDLLCGIACDDWNYDVCFNNSQPFLAKSDIVFVCPGYEKSKGTKRELATANNLSIPIYYGAGGYAVLQSKQLGLRYVVHENDKKLGDLESAKDQRKPYMRADEGTCDEHVGPDEIKPGIKPEIKQDQFIEESNNHSIMQYLKQDPHPGYRIVSVIPLPKVSNPFGPSARYHTYIWELKDA